MGRRKEPLVIKKCENCGIGVPIYHYVRINRKTYCSKKCESEHRKKMHKIIHPELYQKCCVCGKEVRRKPSQIKKNKNITCSQECLNELKKTIYKNSGNHQYGLKGSLNSSWKRDVRISVYGYKQIRVLDHPFRDKQDFVLEHRLIAEKYLLNNDNSIMVDGKLYLKPELVVHHIDHNRLNNDVKNLKIMTRSEHAKLHAKGKI